LALEWEEEEEEGLEGLAMAVEAFLRGVVGPPWERGEGTIGAVDDAWLPVLALLTDLKRVIRGLVLPSLLITTSLPFPFDGDVCKGGPIAPSPPSFCGLGVLLDALTDGDLLFGGRTDDGLETNTISSSAPSPRSVDGPRSGEETVKSTSSLPFGPTLVLLANASRRRWIVAGETEEGARTRWWSLPSLSESLNSITLPFPLVFLTPLGLPMTTSPFSSKVKSGLMPEERSFAVMGDSCLTFASRSIAPSLVALECALGDRLGVAAPAGTRREEGPGVEDADFPLPLALLPSAFPPEILNVGADLVPASALPGVVLTLPCRVPLPLAMGASSAVAEAIRAVVVVRTGEEGATELLLPGRLRTAGEEEKKWRIVRGGGGGALALLVVGGIKIRRWEGVE
jgi:hypothetical protein